MRKIRFNEAMTAAILSNHRRIPPFGAGGGSPGMLGRNWVEKANGDRLELAGTDEVRVQPGDTVVIETPGGGGYGASGQGTHHETTK